jgi:hypothetical protein
MAIHNPDVRTSTIRIAPSAMCGQELKVFGDLLANPSLLWACYSWCFTTDPSLSSTALERGHKYM